MVDKSFTPDRRPVIEWRSIAANMPGKNEEILLLKEEKFSIGIIKKNPFSKRDYLYVSGTEEQLELAQVDYWTYTKDIRRPQIKMKLTWL